MNDLKKLLLHRYCIKSNQVGLVNGCKRMNGINKNTSPLKWNHFCFLFSSIQSAKISTNFFCRDFIFSLLFFKQAFYLLFWKVFCISPSTWFYFLLLSFLNKTNIFRQLTFQLFCPIENWMAHIAHLMSTFPYFFSRGVFTRLLPLLFI